MEYIYNIDKVCQKNIESLKIEKKKNLYLFLSSVI